MTALERTALPVPGPKFERIDGELMFKFVIDGGSVIGPRPATEKDKAEHVGAWRDFCDLDAASGLKVEVVAPEVAAPPVIDIPSFVKKEDPVNERDTLRKDLKMLGVDVDARWGVARLKAELEAATAPKA